MSKILTLLVMAATLSGCRQEESIQVDAQQCDALYNDLLQAYKAYADSLAQIPETDTTDRIIELEARMDKEIWEISKRYPMNMDLLISEAQNDTLWYYTRKYVDERNRHRIRHFELPDTSVLQQDTIE